MTRTLWQSYSFTIAVSAAGTTDVQMLTYDPTLSRVRIDMASLLANLPGLTNPGFEVDASGWGASFGTIARSTAFAHTGVASGLLTPNGSGVAVARSLAASSPLVEVGQQYTMSIWVYAPSGWSSVQALISWIDSTSTVISSSTGTASTLASGVWTKYTATGTAPTGAVNASLRVQMLGTPTSSNLMYVDDASIARSFPSGSTWTVQSSLDLVRWSTVRGGTSILVSATALPLDDYEFDPNVDNHYRVQVYSGASLVHTFTDAITPVFGATDVWLKNIARPFLNRLVLVADAGDMGRRSRTGLFDVVGRSTPIAVTDVRGSRTFELTVQTETAQQASDLDLILSTGDIAFIQTPPDHPVPTGYYAIGDTSQTWRNAPPTQTASRWFSLPLTTVGAPAATVVGATTTWAAVVGGYATWTDLIAGNADWNTVVSAVAGAGDVVVS